MRFYRRNQLLLWCKSVKKIGTKQIENYKWFTKPNGDNSNGKSNKIKINLFTDISGSFYRSEHTINCLIKGLIKLEKELSMFSFDLITMGNLNTLKSKPIKPIRCDEGNYLTNDIIDIYKKVQTPNTSIVNIAVFDGDAQSFDGLCGDKRMRMKSENKKAFSAWNHPNCIIITSANRNSFDKYSPNAKKIYTYDYVKTLEANILKSLELLMR